MACAEDYIGMAFGSFTVGQIIGAGAEAEVFQVLHRGIGQCFVMRLDAKDDATWQGAPLNPPRNVSVESNNIRGSWHATRAYHGAGYMTRKDSDTIVFSIPVIYAVKDLRYLIAISSPFRVRNSMPFDDFINLAKPDDLYLFELWEDVAMELLGDTYQLNSGQMPESEWTERWSGLIGGATLRRAMSRYMDAGTLSGEAKDSIIRRIDQANGGEAELAENILLRVCGAISRGYAPLETIEATVRSSDFRVNLTVHEANQLVACWKVLGRNPANYERSLSLMSAVLSCLQGQPPTLAENGDDFDFRFPDQSSIDYEEFRRRQPIDGYDLFFQQYGGAPQEFLTFG